MVTSLFLGKPLNTSAYFRHTRIANNADVGGNNSSIVLQSVQIIFLQGELSDQSYKNNLGGVKNGNVRFPG
jgi:hypothetical protein